jgi:hypothetical protein
VAVLLNQGGHGQICAGGAMSDDAIIDIDPEIAGILREAAAAGRALRQLLTSGP